LYNKAKIIRDDILEEVEAGIRKIEKAKVTKAQEILKNSDPVFLKREDKLRKIKGMMISAMNRAMNDRDATAVKELKDLLGRFEDALFD
jgi:hypothetical protein